MIISSQVSVAANARSANVLADEAYAFLPKTSTLRFAIVAAAAGLEVDILLGGTSVAQSADVSGANRFPEFDKDTILVVTGKRNERMWMTFLNTTAGAIIVLWTIEIL